MNESNETTTVGIKQCPSCGAGLFESSRFCRRCGVALSTSLPAQHPTRVGSFELKPLQDYTTTPLSKQKLYHPVSGPLVSALLENVPANAQHSPAQSLSKQLLLALMAVPIWVMIILMSPLDAYTSAKIIGSRI
jgi:hypothetical protein